MQDDRIDTGMFDDLPQTFAMREGGAIRHVKDPVYNLLADGYYQDTLFVEGEIIITHMCPNAHMQPLNVAAGENVKKWLATLPQDRIVINIEDLAEAAAVVASDKAITAEMTPEQVGEYTRKVAMRLKAKRDTAGGMILPPMAGDSIFTINQGKSSAPAMPYTRFKEATPGGPGAHSGSNRVLHEPTIDTSTQRGTPAFEAAR